MFSAEGHSSFDFLLGTSLFKNRVHFIHPRISHWSTVHLKDGRDPVRELDKVEASAVQLLNQQRDVNNLLDGCFIFRWKQTEKDVLQSLEHDNDRGVAGNGSLRIHDGVDLGFDRRPVFISLKLLPLSTLSVKVWSKLQLRLEQDVVSQLRVLQNLVKIDLVHRLEVHGRQKNLFRRLLVLQVINEQLALLTGWNPNIWQRARSKPLGDWQIVSKQRWRRDDRVRWGISADVEGERRFSVDAEPTSVDDGTCDEKVTFESLCGLVGVEGVFNMEASRLVGTTTDGLLFSTTSMASGTCSDGTTEEDSFANTSLKWGGCSNS
ncbi:hypothetical protein OGAPHI_004493 [Ogataea philodendri]|uniref:Uncharacterized protein n=1 Tax=Ogataea philodendri TaxID=1378263 RepID=A0A9P8T5H7_9ASCO|nr:uncharacterized protein OGAPHI_004493 [Ogataea philodendri]KAH3666304.1 hypothetical protein OGAPHI_004493 [Ogataea philodendri]